MIAYDDHPLYYHQTPIDSATLLTEATEKSRKLRFSIEQRLTRMFKEQAERDSRRRDVRIHTFSVFY